jgi:hypothetical protein
MQFVTCKLEQRCRFSDLVSCWDNRGVMARL